MQTGVGHAQEHAFSADAGGRFAFVGGFALALRGADPLLHAWAPGYLAVTQAVALPGETTVRLRRGRVLRGRVVDAAGAGVPGATVCARRWPDLSGRLPAALGRLELPDAALFEGAVVARGVAGPDGAFALGGVDDDTPFVTALDAVRRGVARAPPDATAPVTVVLDRAIAVLSLSLRTTDGGPIPRAWLRWRQGPPGSLQSSEERLLHETSWARPATSALVLGAALETSFGLSHARIEVPGYLPAALPALPPEGGQRAFEVPLVPVPAADALTLTVVVHGRDAGDPPALHGVLTQGDPHHPAVSAAPFVVPAGSDRALVASEDPLAGFALPLDVRVAGPDWVGRFLGDPTGDRTGPVVHVDVARAAALEVTFAGAPPDGVAFTLRGGDEALAAVAGFEVPVAGERRPDRAWCLPDGRRWTAGFFAPPAGEGRSARRVEGLAPGRYRLAVPGHVWEEELVLAPGQVLRHAAALP